LSPNCYIPDNSESIGNRHSVDKVFHKALYPEVRYQLRYAEVDVLRALHSPSARTLVVTESAFWNLDDA